MRGSLLGVGCFLAILAGVALAGERPLGQIVVTDAGTVTNLSTAVPFNLQNFGYGPTRTVDIQCDGGAFISEGIDGGLPDGGNFLDGTYAVPNCGVPNICADDLTARQDTIFVRPWTGASVTCNVFAHTSNSYR